jgi:poly [ADP-ribose] polymerase
LFSTPLGVVGQTNIDNARIILEEIRPYVETNKWEDKSAKKLVEKYMSLIPQSIGRQRPSLKTLFGLKDNLDKHSSILDSLQASLDILKQAKTDNSIDIKNPFDISIDVLVNKDKIKLIHDLYENNKGEHECKSLRIKKIYNITINRMNKEYESLGKTFNPVERLWHGTRVSNLLSILAKGFIIPPENANYCTGRMFGSGTYFSNCSTKALQYAYGTWGNRRRDSNCFMFICEVALGKVMNRLTVE